MNEPRLHKFGSGGLQLTAEARQGVLAISYQGCRPGGIQNRLLSWTSPVTRPHQLADECFVASRIRRFRR